MSYRPCTFIRSDYLEWWKTFEDVKLEEAAEELCEFNDNAEDLAFELAYTRYYLAKAEREIDRINEICSLLMKGEAK